jgi:hypothetical protein
VSGTAELKLESNAEPILYGRNSGHAMVSCLTVTPRRFTQIHGLRASTQPCLTKQTHCCPLCSKSPADANPLGVLVAPMSSQVASFLQQSTAQAGWQQTDTQSGFSFASPAPPGSMGESFQQGASLSYDRPSGAGALQPLARQLNLLPAASPLILADTLHSAQKQRVSAVPVSYVS